MSEKKGYVIIAIFLGLAFTGVYIVYAHTMYNEGQYSGIGMSGIHATIDGTLHIPNGIWLGNIGELNNYTLINATNTGPISIVFPDHDGTVVVVESLPFSCGPGQALKGIDEHGRLFCGAIGP